MNRVKNQLIGFFFIIFLSFASLATLATRPLSLDDEKQFDKSLIHADLSVNLWKRFKYSVFKEGLDGVLVGKDGWLFTKEEFAYNANFQENIENNLNYIREVSGRLPQDNIKLIIVPVPAKARIYKENLGRHAFPHYFDGLYDRILNVSLSNGHEVTDTLKIFDKENQDSLFYYKTDTHWTSTATQLIAQSISRHRKNLRMVGEEKKFFGDLVQYVPEKYYTFEAYAEYDFNFRSADLFGNAYFPIVLVGTSYSADTRWNLENFLKFYLGQDVLNVSQKAKGPFQAMQDYLHNEYVHLEKPQQIIWEIPERYLPLSYALES